MIWAYEVGGAKPISGKSRLVMINLCVRLSAQLVKISFFVSGVILINKVVCHIGQKDPKKQVRCFVVEESLGLSSLLSKGCVRICVSSDLCVDASCRHFVSSYGAKMDTKGFFDDFNWIQSNDAAC